MTQRSLEKSFESASREELEGYGRNWGIADTDAMSDTELRKRLRSAEGTTCHRGSVIAAESWGDPFRVMNVPPAPAGMHEDLLDEALGAPGVLVFDDDPRSNWLRRTAGHRAIGVVYSPRGDRRGNWVPTVMGRRYDAFISLDQTRALHPLHREAQPAAEQETYPWST